jgi:hypothetical protein
VEQLFSANNAPNLIPPPVNPNPTSAHPFAVSDRTDWDDDDWMSPWEPEGNAPSPFLFPLRRVLGEHPDGLDQWKLAAALVAIDASPYPETGERWAIWGEDATGKPVIVCWGWDRWAAEALVGAIKRGRVRARPALSDLYVEPDDWTDPEADPPPRVVYLSTGYRWSGGEGVGR